MTNSMEGTENDHLRQDLGESLEEEPEEPRDTDEHLTRQEWENLFGESDDLEAPNDTSYKR